tara:strand:- start:121 stop:606 length:486 start_codon:yes stop_codon:yes gene_type:complete
MIIPFGFLKQSSTTPTNLYTAANALSSDAYEATGTAFIGAVGVTNSTETSTQHDGSFALKATSTDGVSDRVELSLTLADATNYEMKVWVKIETGANWLLLVWVGTTAATPTATPDVSTVSTSWQEFTIPFTTNAASQTFRFYNQGTAATAFWMDNLRIYEV